MTHTHRAVAEAVALGVANGLLLGAGLGAAHRLEALAIASGVGTFLTLTYLLMVRWRQV